MGLFSYFYRKTVVKRYDDDGIVKYFSYKDFDGLNAEPIEFKTPEENTIKGYIYSYPNYNKENIIIFCHGIGGGHRSYMREIETLCKNGYQVVAYDNVGCFESSGRDIRGFTESLNDLVSCISYLEINKYLDNKKLSIIGHSWGGYAAGNILNYYKDIHSICVISGFVSLKLFAKSANKTFAKQIYNFEKHANPKYVDSSSLDAFKNSEANILVIHSKDDYLVSYLVGAGYLKDNLEEKPNVKYLILENKKHNPNYSDEAIKCLYSFYEEFPRLQREKVLKTKEDKIEYMNKLDFYKMTEQDPEVWKEIINNIKRK